MMPDEKTGKDAQDQYEIEVQAGERCARLLESDDFAREIGQYVEDLTRAWLDSGPAEADRREQCYRQVAAISEIMARLQQRVETGKMAQESLARESAARTNGAGSNPG